MVDRRDLVVSAFESRSSYSSPRRVAGFCAKRIWKNATVHITAFDSTHAVCPHPTVPRDIIIIMAQTRKIQLADPRERDGDLTIEVLIWGDYYCRIVKDASIIRLSSSLVLLPTTFGWIVTRNRTGITANESMVNHITLEHLDNDLRRFWELQTIGIVPRQEKPMTTGDFQILQEFRDAYRIEDGHRVVRVPKKNTCYLSPNRDTPQSMFRTLQKRLQQNDALWTIYEEHILDHVVKEQMELAPNTENSTGLFYVQHHAVKKERRRKTIWRIVFDASSSEGNSPSLNDVLEMGPNLLPAVLAPLLRFRGHPVAIFGDIQQAFLQVSGPEGSRPIKVPLVQSLPKR